MINRNPEVIKILVSAGNDTVFKCRLCGHIWRPKLAMGGWKPNAWNCPAGCKARKGKAGVAE